VGSLARGIMYEEVLLTTMKRYLERLVTRY
jgi:hypothetical protein